MTRIHGQVTGLAVSDRHPYMFSCGLDKMVKCWDLEYNKVRRAKRKKNALTNRAIWQQGVFIESFTIPTYGLGKGLHARCMHPESRAWSLAVFLLPEG